VGPSHSIFSIHTTLDQSIITWCLIFQFIFQHHTNVPTETNSKILSDALATNNSPINEFSDLVSQCRSLLLNRNDFVVSYVRRQANKIACSISKASL